MKLDKNSVFKKATILIIRNNKIYFNEATEALSCREWPSSLENDELESWGTLIFHSGVTSINGTIAFWVEDDEVIPILKINETYWIEPDYVYDDLRSRNVITNEQNRLIKEGFDFLNEVVVEGGRMDFSWYTKS